MTNKLTRTVAAFGRRVMISRKKLWLVVEGRSFDVSFYDGMLRKSPSLTKDGYGIQLAELIGINGKAAGGKQHLRSLHQYWHTAQLLRQSTASGDRIIVCLMDKDHDDALNRKMRSTHVLYTNYADVEAEIFAHGRLSRTLRASLSLTKEEARDLSRSIGDPLQVLGTRWREWLTLGCVVATTGVRCAVRPGNASAVNLNRYGKLDMQALSQAHAAVRKSARYDARTEQWVISRFNGIARRGHLAQHVKGKHVPGFLRSAAESKFISIRPISVTGFEHRVTGVMLSTVDFSQPWTRHWLDKLEAF